MALIAAIYPRSSGENFFPALPWGSLDKNFWEFDILPFAMKKVQPSTCIDRVSCCLS